MAVLALTFLYMLAEAIGGFVTNSLALLSDAGHMLADVASLVLALFALWFAVRPVTTRKTYGYYRMEILAALANGAALLVISLLISYEAFQRIKSPASVKGFEVTLIAIGGLAVNAVSAFVLHSASRENLNMRGAFLHVVGDLLGSIAAIIAGVLIMLYGWLWADALGSALISVIIILGAWRLILDSVNVLLEGTPRHINLAVVETSITETPGVAGVHDLHVWTISSGIDALSAHISHDESVSHSELLAVVRNKLHDEFGIDHLTIQMETLDLEAEAVYVCETGTKCFEPTQRASARHGG